MIDPAEFWSSFAYDGTPIRKADPHKLGARVSNETARRILIEIGLPEQLGYELFFFGIHKQPLTLGEFLRQRQRSEMTEVDHYLMIASGDDVGIIVLDGSSGRVYSWKDGGKLQINCSLDKFIEFLCLIQDSLNEIDRNPSIVDVRHLANLANQLMERFKVIDPEGLEESRSYWRELTKRIFLDE
ncbi:SUKH-4 family immunity protein [Streptomyces niveus]|uniref:SUKH-4 family immunity protein n=1 Tax=Streptomyces niveus TaxID=193462 RepID=UPI00369828F0